MTGWGDACAWVFWYEQVYLLDKLLLDWFVRLVDSCVDLAIFTCPIFRRIFNFIELKVNFPIFGINSSPPTNNNLIDFFIISDESTNIISRVLYNRSISDRNIFTELAIPFNNLRIGAMCNHWNKCVLFCFGFIIWDCF